MLKWSFDRSKSQERGNVVEKELDTETTAATEGNGSFNNRLEILASNERNQNICQVFSFLLKDKIKITFYFYHQINGCAHVCMRIEDMCIVYCMNMVYVCMYMVYVWFISVCTCMNMMMHDGQKQTISFLHFPMTNVYIKC